MYERLTRTNETGRQAMSTSIRAGRNTVACLIGLLCASRPIAAELVQLKSRFDPEQVQWVAQPGDAHVSGTALLTLGDGSRKNCAGFKVELLPVAEYSSERIRLTYGNNRQGQILLNQNPPAFTPDAPEYHELLLKSQCDEQGVFAFDKVPAGEYYVMVFIIWHDMAGGEKRPQGGAVMKRIRVGAGAQVRVAMGG